MNRSKVGMTISGDLIAHVRLTLDLSLRYMLKGRGARQGNNGHAPHALPAYVIAVASVEAFLNEAMLSPLSLFGFGSTPLDQFDKEVLERQDLLLKLQLLPQIAAGRTMLRDAQPFQDFQILVKLRNEIVHYKMAGPEPKVVKDLEQRGIAIAKPENAPEGAGYLWVQKISCTEGIRWANNTACRVVHELAGFAEQDGRASMAGLADNFVEISAEDVEVMLRAMSSSGAANT